MADNRKVISGVVIGNKTIVDPDELEEVMTPEMCERLTKSGAISGDWKPKGKKAEEPKKEK